MNYRFYIACVGLPLVLLFSVTLYCFFVLHRLPDPMAIRWGTDGEPTGLMSGKVFLAVYMGLSLVLVGSMMATTLMHQKRPLRSMLIGLTNGFSWFTGVTLLGIVMSQVDRTEPGSLSFWTGLWGLAGGIGGAWIGGLVGGPPPPLEPSWAPAPPEANRYPLPEGHTAVWMGYTPISVAMSVIAGLAFVEGIIFGLVGLWMTGILTLAVAMFLVAVAAFRVTIGPKEVEVAGWLVGYPRLRLPLTDLRSAEVGTVDAMAFMGWGIRAKGNETAVITEPGPGLVLTRTDNHTVRISLSNPEPVAALLSTLLDQRAQQALVSVTE